MREIKKTASGHRTAIVTSLQMKSMEFIADKMFSVSREFLTIYDA